MILKNIKHKKLHDDIFLWKNIIDKKDCKEIIQIAEQFGTWEKSITSGNLEDYRKSQVVYLTNIYGQNSYLYWAHNIIGYGIKRVIEEMFSFYKLNDNEHSIYISNDEGFQLLRYEKGDYYKLHVDNGGEKVNRILSVLIYLNDDYDGGETYFTRQNVKVKGKTGDILVFPSNYCYHHSAEEVKEGTKYSVVTWFR